MDDQEVTPLLFANKVIHKFVSNLLGREIDGKGASTIRVVFRNCGGDWQRILGGDPVHIGLLLKLVQAWGKASPQKPKDQSQEVFANA
jgi:hypothetical protein